MASLRAIRVRVSLIPVALALGAAVAVALFWTFGDTVFPRRMLSASLAAAAALAYRLALDGRRRRFIAVGVLLGCALVGVQKLGSIAVENFHEPRTWDFLAFYVDGSVGARGLNFYQAENYRSVYPELAIPITAKPDFVPEIVDVGFKYPPMTMFLFCWMGLLTFGQAHVLWLALVCLTYGIAAWVVARRLLVDGSLPIRLLASITFIALLPASMSNMRFEQTNALLLAVSVLCLTVNSGRRAGLYAALAIAIKPILALAAGYYFLRARWVAFAYFLGGLLAFFAAATAVFGPQTVFDYVRANPVGNAPPWLFTEWINQSLLATLLRQSLVEIPASQAIWYAQFLLVGGAVGALSLWLAWRLARKGDELAFGLLVGAALLLYPGTLTPYGMLMIIPLAQLGMRLWHTIPGTVCFSVMMAIVYYIDTRMPFAAHAIVWSATCLWAVCAEKFEPWLRAGGNPDPAGREPEISVGRRAK